MPNKNSVIASLKSIKDEIGAKYHIDSLALFGSVARGEAKADSDIDILFEVQEGAKLSLFSYLELTKELEDRLHSKVDLVRKSKLKEELMPYVLRDVVYV